MFYYNRLLYNIQVTEKRKPADRTPIHIDKIYILFTMHVICIEIRIFTRKPITGNMRTRTYL